MTYINNVVIIPYTEYMIINMKYGGKRSTVKFC
jgi:hypothetical protein